MLILAPSDFFVEREIMYNTVMEDSTTRLDFRFPALFSDIYFDAMLQVVTQSVEVIVDHWQKLYDKVRKECDGGNISFMDGEQYVNLLYDDGAFRRSRFYFWAIGCLGSFEQSVAETLWELALFRTEVDEKSQLGNRASKKRTRGLIYNQETENFDLAYKNLQVIHGQLTKKRDEMKVLRDGVCLQICILLS